MSEDLLTVDHLVVEYPVKGFRSRPFRVLHGVSVSVKPGETLGVVGESGCGKTTLGRAILGLAPVTQGTIVFDGKDISHASRKERQTLGQHLQVVFQDPYTSLNPAMTIGDILSEPLGIQGIKGSEARARVKVLLDRVKLPVDAMDRLPREFSGGQRQRVALARALAIEPRMLLLDEPFGALDAKVRKELRQGLRDIHDTTGLTTVFVTHDQDEAMELADLVVVMSMGRIEQIGKPQDLRARPATPFVREFLGA